jgi:hypothetical protein
MSLVTPPNSNGWTIPLNTVLNVVVKSNVVDLCSEVMVFKCFICHSYISKKTEIASKRLQNVISNNFASVSTIYQYNMYCICGLHKREGYVTSRSFFFFFILRVTKFCRGIIACGLYRVQCTPQSIHSVPGFLSSRPHWVTPPCPPPHPQASVAPHFGSRGETHLLAGERGGGPNSDEGTDTPVLKIIPLRYTPSLTYMADS